MLYRFNGARVCDFSFLDNAENELNKSKSDETKFRDTKKQQRFFATNFKDLRKEFLFDDYKTIHQKVNVKQSK